MRTPGFDAEDLRKLLRRQRLATMPELKAALGTTVDVTVFRKLKELSYRTSYSHRGQYYTLDEFCSFDEYGLWACGCVWFSAYGTLRETVRTLVEAAEVGRFASELADRLHVSVKEPLLNLVRDKQLRRRQVAARYLYCSADPQRSRDQLVARNVQRAVPGGNGPSVRPAAASAEVKAAIVLFHSLLEEKQRRLYAGLEALKLGHGGDCQLAEFLGLDVGTVARGRRELLNREVELERVRRPGGGRKAVEKKRPQS